MADRPILFSAPMVRALLDGRKTQTRRVAKIPAIMGNMVAIGPHESLIELEDGEFRRGICHYASTGALSGPYRLPYAVGDRLYVREAWRVSNEHDDRPPRDFAPITRVRFDADTHLPERLIDIDAMTGKFRQGMHMPRWASRITLIVTDVRVQRLQEISSADAVAEGVRSRLPDNGIAVTEFMDLWDSINAGRGFGWQANPWVVAVSFDVIKQNIDQIEQPEVPAL